MTNTSQHSDRKRLDKLAGVVILAGGASSRMGTPKAELTLPTGERLLDYHVRHASNLNSAGMKLPIMIADNGRGFKASSNLALASSQMQSTIIHIADYKPLTSNTSLKAYSSINNSSENSSTALAGNVKIETGGALIAIEAALQTLNNLEHSRVESDRQSSWLLVMSCDSLIPASDLWSTLQPLLAQADNKEIICLSDESHLYPLLGLYRLSIEPELKAYIDSGQRRVMSFIKPKVYEVRFIKAWQYLTNFNTPKDFKRACTALSGL